MGLDTMILRLEKVAPRYKWTSDEIEKEYPDHELRILEPDKNPQDISLAPGFPKEFVFKCDITLIDYDKWLESKSTPERPVRHEEWEWRMEGTSPALKSSEVPGCSWYVTFRRKDSVEQEPTEKNTIDLPVYFDGKADLTFSHVETRDCVLEDGDETGYCRKSFKDDDSCQRFYDDMRDGKPCFLFRKEDVDEYAKKYFNDDFKALIADKFVEGDGRLVDFWY